MFRAKVAQFRPECAEYYDIWGNFKICPVLAKKVSKVAQLVP